jgi:hypothetical protein
VVNKSKKWTRILVYEEQWSGWWVLLYIIFSSLE